MALASTVLTLMAGVSASPPMDLTTSNPSIKPHLIFVMADDLGWANVGWHNPAHTSTPHLDLLVKDGIELDRHYIFWYCAPSRSSFLTGRLPIHVNEDFDDCTPEGTAPHNMTLISNKLKQAGYATHQVGKWGVGQASHRSLPNARGFDTSFGYLGSAEDHYTHHNGGCGHACKGYNKSGLPFFGTDLWETDRPAPFKWNGTYSAEMYNERVIQIISEHDPSTPLFLYLAAQNCHGPDEGDRWAQLFSDYTNDYAQYNGMTSALDSMVANMTGVLQSKGMWQNTLLVFSSDNGGPSGIRAGADNANNWPLRGGKASAWEGGHRVAAFVSGGLVPKVMRGQRLDGYIHVADWYPTFCGLAAISPHDAPEGLPAVDGIDMWPYLSGATNSSARTELALSSIHANVGGGAALIQGDFKLIRGPGQESRQQTITGGCSWTAPVYPNASSGPPTPESHCSIPATGWLYNIRKDPSEHFELSSTHPDVHAKLLKRAKELDNTQINFIKGAGWRGQEDPDAACKAAVANGGVWGPHLSSERTSQVRMVQI